MGGPAHRSKPGLGMMFKTVDVCADKMFAAIKNATALQTNGFKEAARTRVRRQHSGVEVTPNNLEQKDGSIIPEKVSPNNVSNDSHKIPNKKIVFGRFRASMPIYLCDGTIFVHIRLQHFIFFL